MKEKIGKKNFDKNLKLSFDVGQKIINHLNKYDGCLLSLLQILGVVNASILDSIQDITAVDKIRFLDNLCSASKDMLHESYKERVLS
jgi:hypothetical protein